MFFKQIFLSAIIFSSVVVYAHARDDIITLPSMYRDVKITLCEDCPVPGRECRSYIATSTDKICISSHPSTNNAPVKNAEANAVLHEEANKEDSRGLESDINYPAYRVSDPVVDISEALEKGPFVE